MFEVILAVPNKKGNKYDKVYRTTFEALVNKLRKGSRIEADIFLAKSLFDNNTPAIGGFPHLVAWGLSGLEWEQFTFPLQSSDLDLALAILRRFPIANRLEVNHPLAVQRLLKFFDRQKRLADATPKGNSVLLTLVKDGKVNFDQTSTNLGITHMDGGKSEKRASQIGRPYLVAVRVPSHRLTYTILEDERLEKVLDGTITISRRFFEECIEGMNADKDLLTVPTVNFRAWLPYQGLVKGMALVADSLPGDVDMVFHRANVKQEVVVDSDHAIVAWDPQGSKPCAYTDKQSLRNFSWFWGIDRPDLTTTRLYSWIKDDLKEVVRCVQAGVVPEEERLLLQLAQSEGRVTESFTTGERFEAIDWLRVGGGKQAELPRLFRNTVNNHLERMCSSDWDERDVRIKIPGSFYAQIVSLEAVKHVAPKLALAGLEYGKIFYLDTLQVFVVSNQFWLDNLLNWGGCDLDDKFRLIFRLVNGRVMVFIYRTPNDRNEYALAEAFGNLPPLQGDWEAEPFFWPESRPPQASTLKEPRFELKVSKRRARSKPVKRTFRSFLAKVGMPSNPGWAINIISLYNSGYDSVCPLPSMESIVDLNTAEKDPVRIEKLNHHCLNLVSKMAEDVNAGKVKLDLTLANSVFGVAKSMGLEVRPNRSNLYDSPYSRLVELVHTKVVDGKHWFSELMPRLCADAWSVKLPRLQHYMKRLRANHGDTVVNTMVDRVNKVFKGWSLAYKLPSLDYFRVGNKMAPMGYEIVSREHFLLVKEQVQYLWRKFRGRLNMRFRVFMEVLSLVALHQLFSQASDDNPQPVIDSDGKMEEGSLITDPRWFRLFLKVRSKF